ncbi:hypothetical protein BUL74_01645 [Salmonella enterica subsp. enterica serovar 4,[5],12:i:-]|nr:hypothetical protein [Salmonella enterica]ECU8272941.1 hypothetical protein [Salmonella enterica subsp. enterica serovar 4,[5],12:i:-]EDD5564735.1 hypothetical protein [Salmonella enterica subsp. enterica serovar Bareilly]EDD5596275.1 hypothetical protein [Salmonella enterica subsp. enterica serovar Montevideo]EKP6363731.1 hypothetical protein [Salmonella enterica subsp. diarizonae]
MVKLVSSGRGKISYLEKRLSDNNYHFPSSPADKDYPAYQQRVIRSFISAGGQEQTINTFLAETDRLYAEAFPSENELKWYHHDPRASLWLVCELYEELKSNRDENSASYLSPTSLQPAHNVRMDAIRCCIDDWPLMLFTPAYFLKKKSIEWADLLDKHNLFRDVNARSVDVCSWLKNHIHEKTDISLNRTCGNTPEEVMAWCYASYFIWRKNNLHSPDTVELFIRKFKSAWSTQKNRIKNKMEKKLKPLNVNISQEAHDMLRHIATEEGISNDRVIESALMLIYKNKTKK